MNGQKNIGHRRRTFWEIASDLFGKSLFIPLPPSTPEILGSGTGSSAGGNLGSAGRQAFIKAYNSNAMNFLPGAIVYNIYRRCANQDAMAARSKTVLEGSDHLHLKAMARGYTG